MVRVESIWKCPMDENLRKMLWHQTFSLWLKVRGEAPLVFLSEHKPVLKRGSRNKWKLRVQVSEELSFAQLWFISDAWEPSHWLLCYNWTHSKLQDSLAGWRSSSPRWKHNSPNKHRKDSRAQAGTTDTGNGKDKLISEPATPHPCVVTGPICYCYYAASICK